MVDARKNAGRLVDWPPEVWIEFTIAYRKEYPHRDLLLPGFRVRVSEFDAVQREFREVPGVSALIRPLHESSSTETPPARFGPLKRAIRKLRANYGTGSPARHVSECVAPPSAA